MDQGKTHDITFVAAEDLRLLQYRAVNAAGNLADTPAEAIGVLQTKPHSGEHGAAACMGEAKVKTGGALTAGALVTVAASGFFVAYTAVASGAQPSVPVGKALVACNSGDICRVLVNFANAGLV